MTDLVDPPSAYVDEAEWRLTLPEVFRPIAERYGKHRFAVAWNAGAVQEGLHMLANTFEKNKQIRAIIMSAAAAANQLAFYAAESQQMTYQDIRNIQIDMERAAALSAASRQPDGAGGRIIIPS